MSAYSRVPQSEAGDESDEASTTAPSTHGGNGEPAHSTRVLARGVREGAAAAGNADTAATRAGGLLGRIRNTGAALAGAVRLWSTGAEAERTPSVRAAHVAASSALPPSRRRGHVPS